MNALTLNKKLELIQWLATLEDSSIIEKLLKFREEEVKDWWDSASEAEKISIEKGIFNKFRFHPAFSLSLLSTDNGL